MYKLYTQRNDRWVGDFESLTLARTYGNHMGRMNQENYYIMLHGRFVGYVLYK